MHAEHNIDAPVLKLADLAGWPVQVSITSGVESDAVSRAPAIPARVPGACVCGWRTNQCE
jgi:hypothetical protein